MTFDTRFDAELIRRYDRQGPRYTSYPTAAQFQPFDAQSYRTAALLSNSQQTPLSIYVHVPFCASPCFYCGCNRVITRNPLKAQRYVAALCHEIELQAALFGAHRPVRQLHFGGGTPTFLTLAQLEQVLGRLRQAFALVAADDREYSIEIDPRTVDAAMIEGLARLGFNRLSLGIQDFDPAVQAAVNRIQPLEDTRSVVAHARQHGIREISFDLIYGLPRQTTTGFARTLDEVVALRPTRIATYGYAHLPALFKAQRQIDPAELPAPAQRLALLELTVQRLQAAGYVHIGMDHFALPDDGLTQAMQAGTLQRNFQGYSSHAQCDLIGLGVSAIGRIGDCHTQNARDLAEYHACLERHQLPIRKGIRLNSDDRVRRDVIQQIMCGGQLDFGRIEQDHCIDFRSYFSDELKRLAPMHADGLLMQCAHGVAVTPAGRLLLRNIAMVFDAYLKAQAAGFSRAI